MSIAVMNWVWANSPTSGNERLVLLALADACSRDDGTGCFPSVREIARKARISDRSVPRVIARLEDGEHVQVHRGGGRASNRYTVLIGIHSPRQADTPDNLSGGGAGDRAPLTQPCHPSPDVTVSPDPPCNHHGTAAPARTRDAATSSPAGEAGVEAAEVRGFFTALGPRWLLTASQRRRLTPAVQAAVAAGWTPAELARFVGANADGVRSPFAVLRARLSPGELPASASAGRTAPRPPWCGICDETTRMLDYNGDAPYPCPRCKPSAAAGGRRSEEITVDLHTPAAGN